MQSLLSRLFPAQWLKPAEPQLVDQVELRFIADLAAKPGLQVAVINSDGSIAAMSSIAGIAHWLQFHGFHYAIGSSGRWVRTAS